LRIILLGPRSIPAVLSIAGSDSGGGAGIQADLKAFARCGVHGMTAVTAITAQSTVQVSAVEAVSPEMIVEQVRVVVEDIGVDAVKIGMLGTVETIAAVGEALDLVGDVPVVLDPVMVAESGAMLSDQGARDALARDLLPRVTVTTPNLAEARALAEIARGEEAGGASQEELAEAVLSLGPSAVIVTGGHTDHGADLLLEAPGEVSIVPVTGRHPDGGAHGSGCTHSSVLAARLAVGKDLFQAACDAHAIAAEAVGAGLRDLGAGPGPVDALGISQMREMRTWA